MMAALSKYLIFRERSKISEGRMEGRQEEGEELRRSWLDLMYVRRMDATQAVTNI